MARTALALVASLAWLLDPYSADAQCSAGSGMTLTDGEGFTWDVTGTGGISNGTGDAFDCGVELSVDGVRFPGSPLVPELGGRQFALGPVTMGPLEVTRRIYVPEASGWARALEYVTNPGATPVDATILLESNMGSDSGTTVVATSSGDTTYTTADRWICTDDSDSGGDPSMSHNYWGAGALSPSAVSLTVYSSAGTEGTAATFSLTIPPSTTVIVMYFVTQSNNRAESMTKAAELDLLPAEALVGISAADAAGIVNWATGGGAMDLPNGATCIAPSQCISGFCVDGRCCNRECNLACEVCSVAAGALSDGSCVMPADGCSTIDGGPPPLVDGGGRRDATITDPPRRRPGGCCAVAGASDGAPPLWLVSPVVVAWALRRRSRARQNGAGSSRSVETLPPAG